LFFTNGWRIIKNSDYKTIIRNLQKRKTTMKQTAIEFLIKQLEILNLIKEGDIENELFRQIELEAKEMEKQQIIDSNISGMEFIAVDPNKYNEDAEKYYNETFKNR
jgi:hypothetical protein